MVRDSSLVGSKKFINSKQMFDSFKLADHLYDFFSKNGIRNKVYEFYFGNINYGIRHFDEDRHEEIASVLFDSLKNKPEIKILEDGFFVCEKKYEINASIFSKIKQKFQAYNKAQNQLTTIFN